MSDKPHRSRAAHATAPAPATKTITTYLVLALSLTGVAILCWRLSDVFVVAFGGIVLAAALCALAEQVARVTHLSPRWSLAVVVTGLLFIAIVPGWLFGHQATQQLHELEVQLPAATEKFQAWMQQTRVGRFLLDSAHHAGGDSAKTFTNVTAAARATVKAAATVFLLAFLAIYFAVDPKLYHDGALRLLPPGRRAQVASAFRDAGYALRRWLLAQGVAMITIGVLAGVSLALLHVPLAFALGIVAGILEFIPVLGPILFSIPGVLLAFAKSPELACYTLLVYVIVQQIEANVIIPLLQRWAGRLPPVVCLLAVVAGGVLFGPMGIIFATPMAVVVMAMVKHLYIEDALEK